jgi:hypothetical protein
MPEACIHAMLQTIKKLSSIFCRFDINWVHRPPADPWRQLRLVTFLNPIVDSIPQGPMLLAYSAGLHHVQTPGQRNLTRLFKTQHMRLEIVDSGEYRRRLMDRYGPDGFKRALIHDLGTHRDKHGTGREADAIQVYATSLA